MIVGHVIVVAATESSSFGVLAIFLGIGFFLAAMCFLISLRFKPIFRSLSAKYPPEKVTAMMQKKVSSVKRGCAACIIIGVGIPALVLAAHPGAGVVACGMIGSAIILAAAIYILAKRLNYRD